MELRAKVIEHLPMQGGVSRNGNEWKKATLIVETIEPYPKKIAIMNLRNADEFNSIPMGTIATFGIDIESRLYNNRWYTEVSAWSWSPENPNPITASNPFPYLR